MTELYQVGQYRLETLLDSRRLTGGLILTRYRATDTVRKRPVLANLLQPGAELDAADLLRLLDAAQPAGELVHPHLAWTWEGGLQDGQYVLIDRAVQGQTLAQRLTYGGPLTWPEAQTVLEHLGRGLDFAHAHGWVHGGLSPHDIWLAPDQGTIISGWGLLRGLQAARLGLPDDSLPYQAPEVLTGQAPTAPGDQFALAALAFEMLTGQPAYHGADRQPVTLPPEWPEGTPWGIEAALDRAFSPDPAQRFANLAALLAALEKPGDGAALSDAERARRAEAILQRQAQAEAVQRQAEDVVRLAALEQARRELDQQLRQPAAETDETAPPADEQPDVVLAAAADATPVDQPPTDQPAAVEQSDTLQAAPPAASDDAAILAAAATLAAAGTPDAVTPPAMPLAAGEGEAPRAGKRGLLAQAARRSAGSAASPAAPPPAVPGPSPVPAAALVTAGADSLAGDVLPAAAVTLPVDDADLPRRAVRRPRTSAWTLWIGGLLALALLGGMWWTNRPVGGATLTATPTVTLAETATATAAVPVIAPTATVPAPTVAPSSTATASPSATRPTFTPTRTHTRTPTPTLTATPSPSASPTRYKTNTPPPRRDPDTDRDGGNPPTRP